MKRKIGLLALLVLVLLFVAGPAFSLDIEEESSSTEELERKLDLLADEIDDLKSSGISAGTANFNRVTVHGYGETHFNHNPRKNSTQVDQHRFVFGIHALLADWIHLNAEIDFEHAAQKLEFEFGHVDFLLDPAFNIRAGVLLAPTGSLNEFHEPNLFWTVERPLLQKQLIPTSWNSTGAGIYGNIMDGVNYRVYYMNSLQSISRDSTKDGSGTGNGGSASSFSSGGIRGGRGEANERIADDFSIFARVEFTRLMRGLQVGFSIVDGDTTHNIIEEGGHMTLLEADLKYRWRWFDMNASVVNTEVDDSAAMNTFCASAAGAGCTVSSTSGIAANNFGYNVQVGVHLPQLIGWRTTHDIVPHFMFERVRTQDEMEGGTAPDRSKNRNGIYTFGIAYLPIPEVSIKMDHTHTKLEDKTTEDQFNLGIAYMF